MDEQLTANPIPAVNPNDGHTYDVRPFFDLQTDFFEIPDRHLAGLEDAMDQLPVIISLLPPEHHDALLKAHAYLLLQKHVLRATRRL